MGSLHAHPVASVGIPDISRDDLDTSGGGYVEVIDNAQLTVAWSGLDAVLRCRVRRGFLGSWGRAGDGFKSPPETLYPDPHPHNDGRQGSSSAGSMSTRFVSRY